jgi:signal transduction histidine kinase
VAVQSEAGEGTRFEVVLPERSAVSAA